MNAFLAENAAWKVKTAGQGLTSDGHSLVLAIKRVVDPRTGDTRADAAMERIRSARKMIADAADALAELELALATATATETGVANV